MENIHQTWARGKRHFCPDFYRKKLYDRSCTGIIKWVILIPPNGCKMAGEVAVLS